MLSSQKRRAGIMKLSNDQLEVVVEPFGAELQRIRATNDQTDYLWNGDPKYWKRHAPLLFPAIGNSNDGVYLLKDGTYSMTQHGFARDFPFEVVTESDTHVQLQQSDNDQTYEMFPFHYLLQVDYHLVANKLFIRFSVTNKSDREMPFSIGSHPAFNVPLNQEGSFEDYFIRTSPETDHLRIFEATLDPKPYRTGRVVRFGKDAHGLIHLNHDMFKNGLLIFENPGIDEVELFSPKTNHSVVLNIKQFPYFTLWTPEHDPAPFICIEPFAGLPDVLGQTVDWYKKEGNLTLAVNEKAVFSYDISFY